MPTQAWWSDVKSLVKDQGDLENKTDDLRSSNSAFQQNLHKW